MSFIYYISPYFIERIKLIQSCLCNLRYVQTATSAIVAPNFTENGWGLTRAPQKLVDDLRQAIKDGLPKAELEGKIQVIEGEQPLFISRSDLTRRV